MEPRTIETGSGTLELIAATIGEIRGIARYWPLGILANDNDPDHLGLVFQHGDREMHGVKMQTVDYPPQTAPKHNHVQRALIAAALPFYLEKGHRGVTVPLAYYKAKPSGKVETGIAFFVGPDPENPSKKMADQDRIYDESLGIGATEMIFDMAGAIGRASQEVGIPLSPIIGMDFRPRHELGPVAIHFVIEGPRVFVVKVPLDDDEPVWPFVVRAGFTRLPYHAMYPAELPPGTDIPRR